MAKAIGSFSELRTEQGPDLMFFRVEPVSSKCRGSCSEGNVLTAFQVLPTSAALTVLWGIHSPLFSTMWFGGSDPSRASAYWSQ